MKIALLGEGFAPYALLAEHEAGLVVGSYGASCSFIGTMRDFNQGDDIAEMDLEHYPGMTERFLQRIADDAARHWRLLDGLIAHRHGRVMPGDPIVLIGVWSVHRGVAFEACRFIIEELKHEAPFWKREVVANGSGSVSRWVEENTAG